MKISYNWLKDYIQTDHSPEEVSQILTSTGLEVEGLEKIESIKGGLSGVIIGEVLTKEKHPDADRLNITTVNIGSGEALQIVCGAPNVEAGQKVVVATVGTTIYPTPETPLKIKKSKIRGVESFGMICAEDELGLGKSHDGILVLDESVVVGTPAQKHFSVEDDYLIEIGLTPNRADAMGHIGVARDLKAYLNFHEQKNISLTIPETNVQSESSNLVKILNAEVDACPRYAGAIITGMQVGESPEWLQLKLRSIGLKPINNVVDITNFVMHETGNPLHAFDAAKVDGSIIVRYAKPEEKLKTLDEVERSLDVTDLVIANKSEAMCLAGVFGGLDSGVKSTTTALFLEAAYFSPVIIRKAAKRHGLNTDSSFRFERGVDIDTVLYARDRAIELILELSGGKLEGVYDNYPQKIKAHEVDFSFDQCRKLCGITISDEKITEILNELDIQVHPLTEKYVRLEIPSYRVDVTREADVIEEVLRIYGFDNVPLPEKLHSSLSFANSVDKELMYNRVADLLVDNGFNEIMNNSLTSSENWLKMNSATYQESEDVKILNPLSNELDVMRQTLAVGGLKSIAHNQNRQHPDVKFFEFGKVYSLKDKNYIESQKLGVWMSGNELPENWDTPAKKADFYSLKAICESILIKLGIFKGQRYSTTENDLFEDGLTLKIANKVVAEFGWLKKSILKNFDVKDDVFYADFEWDTIISLQKMNKINFETLPKTQFARRDFSLLLDKSVTFESIAAIAHKADKKILKEVGLFDVYEGKNLENGKKSYAVSFIFQDEEKTLKDKQIDTVMQKIREGLETNLNAQLR
jgi:phenylalanyl-tRNA synthetase beta chain